MITATSLQITAFMDAGWRRHDNGATGKPHFNFAGIYAKLALVSSRFRAEKPLHASPYIMDFLFHIAGILTDHLVITFLPTALFADRDPYRKIESPKKPYSYINIFD